MRRSWLPAACLSLRVARRAAAALKRHSIACAHIVGALEVAVTGVADTVDAGRILRDRYRKQDATHRKRKRGRDHLRHPRVHGPPAVRSLCAQASLTREGDSVSA